MPDKATITALVKMNMIKEAIASTEIELGNFSKEEKRKIILHLLEKFAEQEMEKKGDTT